MGQHPTEPGPEDFPGDGNRTGGVQSLWPVLHVLIILLSHLGQAE